ncbi:MAG: hypothetical protein DHS20C02_07920 [Micavibrio sp.]|nr:MAG: hypothetical protein DHS20C02_07920 [Micavibrio sp.]
MVERNIDELDTLLTQRVAPPPPRSNLSERIIEASLQSKPKRRSGFMQGLDGLADMFVLPRPAYALAAVLFLGVVGGFYYQVPVQDADDTYLDAYFLYMDDVAAGEEWL